MMAKGLRMNLRRSSIGLTLAAIGFFNLASANAQTVAAPAAVLTVDEFLTTKDGATAIKKMELPYTIALDKQVNLFRAKGYNDRADYITQLKPNLTEIYARAELAHRQHKNADMVAVIRGYLIDASSPESRAQQAPAPTKVPEKK